jgi:7,8-dihydroneopterin aldolase/epimerase/oxygenase
MDKVFIKNLQVLGILGIHAHEQRTPQLIRISAAATTDIKAAAQADDIRQTVNYSTLAKRITAFIDANPCLTIEALIEALAAEILTDERIQTIWLRIEKPNAVPTAETVGVEINRSRQA